MNRLLVTGYCLSATALFLSPLSAEEGGVNKGAGGRWYDVGGAKKQGLRPHMEDEFLIYETPQFSLFGVFDGHGGHRTSLTARTFFGSFFEKRIKNGEESASALANTFSDTQKKYGDLHPDNNGFEGSTGVVAVLLHPSGEDNRRLLVGNAGDSRCIIVQKDGSKRGKIYETKDHKPTDNNEKERIYRLGGSVRAYPFDVPRVFGKDGGGGLALSRALGDFYYGEMVPCTPDLSLRSLSPQDQYIILASDGVWDVLSSTAAADFVWQSFGKGVTAQEVSEALIDKALSMGSSDNVAAVVIDLNNEQLRGHAKL